MRVSRSGLIAAAALAGVLSAHSAIAYAAPGYTFLQEDTEVAGAAAVPRVTMRSGAQVALNGETMSDEALVEHLQALRAGGYAGRIDLDAEGDVSTAEVRHVINLIQDGGFAQIGIVAEAGQAGGE